MRVLVCGGRDYRDHDFLAHTLTKVSFDYEKFDVVITGGASGADGLADAWARHQCLPALVFPANWIEFGAAAGPMRNQRMLDEGKPDLVVAFPGGRGTADMVRRAREAGVEVIEIKT